MSEAQSDAIGSTEQCKAGPDFFSFYACEIAELLSQNENTSTSSPSELGKRKYGVANGKDTVDDNPKVDSYFENSIGVGLSDFKKGRLKALLRQSVEDLSMEVDEMLDPVLSTCELKSKLRGKTLSTAASDSKAARGSSKLKMSSASSPTSTTGNSSQMKSGSCKEVEDDLHILLENDNPLWVEEIMKKHSNELSSTLSHMEQKLEEILDTIMSKCRPMVLAEKQQLQMLIQKLPEENLARVVEIIQRGRSTGIPRGDEFFVDLEREDNVTLWTLYYYVEAVEKAKILADLQ